jgi:2,4-dienoyl-CoA reductase-like NADH-dependent reductase (Old Yellow Enzyme family)/thioredoxin reductase
MEVRNRIIASPMERNYCTAEGRITQRYIDYLEARSRGGVGTMYTEATYVDPRGRGRELQMGLYRDDLIPELRRLTDAVHRHGARIGPELHYGGRVVNPAVSALQSRAPSVVPYVGAGGWSPRALTRDEIADIVQRFADAAVRAREAGCDFVGLHGAHGYLLSQFFSPHCNKRDDEYGGDLAARMRFPLEVVRAVRAAIGSDMPILYRLSGDEHMHDGISIEDVCQLAPQLQAAGVDLIDVSAGMYETNWWITQPMEMPQALLTPLSRAVRPHVSIPVSVSGRINDPSVAEHVLASQDADFVTMGRAMHADPEFANKAREGRQDEICMCIACNQGCSDLHARGQPIVCLVNTASGRERDYAIQPVQTGKRIVVVGAGPAGLECARILSQRGHRVTVFDKSDEPGGQMLLSRVLPGREDVAGHVPWLFNAASRAGVRIELGIELTADAALAEQPDAIVLATGAAPGIPNIPGIMDSPVIDLFEVLRRPMGGARRALVIGGGIRGLGVARLLAGKGVQVVIAEAGDELVTDIATRSRRFQIEGAQAPGNVTVHVRTTVEALGEHEAVLCNGDTEWRVTDLDWVIPTRPMLPVTELSDALSAKKDVPPLFFVGDCVLPRTALEAIHDAAALGHRL